MSNWYWFSVSDPEISRWNLTKLLEISKCVSIIKIDLGSWFSRASTGRQEKEETKSKVSIVDSFFWLMCLPWGLDEVQLHFCDVKSEWQHPALANTHHCHLMATHDTHTEVFQAESALKRQPLAALPAQENSGFDISDSGWHCYCQTEPPTLCHCHPFSLCGDRDTSC